MSDYLDIASITKYSELYGKNVNNREFLHYIKNVNVEEWRLGDKFHREDGPASIQYYKNGNVMCEHYYQNGKLHREDGPACIYYYENGNIMSKYYYQNDKLHREDGNVHSEEYFQNGGYFQNGEYFQNGVLQK